MAQMTVRVSKKRTMPSITFTTLIFMSIATTILLLIFFQAPSSFCTSSSRSSSLRWSGDLRKAEFSWNLLPFLPDPPPPVTLKIAVFTRKWPVATAPGGMERHAMTLHNALSLRGHRVHIFTAAIPDGGNEDQDETTYPRLHYLTTTYWRSEEAYELFDAEHMVEPFDAVHSESVALHHREAAKVPNLAVSWHGISLEVLHSHIYQDLIRPPTEPISPAANRSLATAIFRLLDEIRFFHRYAHHVATSDATGEMLRDVYQIPRGRVHVILNGVDEDEFRPDSELGKVFLAEIGVPKDAEIVFGVAGRLVRDKGHPLLHEAFSKLVKVHRKVYLVVAGTGPWAQRYVDLGPQVIWLGALQPNKLRAFYNAIDVFVNPTLRPQGLDLTLMEAMRCGTPVVVTRFPSVKGSVVVDSEFGHMFAPNAAALEETLRLVVSEGRDRLAHRGRAAGEYAAEMFTSGKMALAYERLFLCIKDETYCMYPQPFDL